jgi:hypothetical protein
MSRVEEFTVTYRDVDASLSAIGGIANALLILPSMLPDIEEATLQTIERGIEDGLPVDLRVDLPGVSYVVHVRAADDDTDAGDDGASDPS